MGYLEQIRVVDPVLTQLAWDYKDPDFVSDALFPVVNNLDKMTGKIPVFGKEAFYVYDTERALGANSNVAPKRARTEVAIGLVEHDFVDAIDYNEIGEDIFPREAQAVDFTSRVIRRRLEILAAAEALNTGNYASGNYATLSGTSQFSHGSSTPISTVKAAKEVIRGKIGTDPNTMLMGATVFNALCEHSTLISRIQYAVKGILTKDLLAELFEVQNVVVGKSVYCTDAGVMTDIWGDALILAYVPPPPQGNQPRSEREPSFGYTFRRKGFPNSDKWDTEGGKIHNVRTTDQILPKIVGNTAGYLMLDCLA